MGTIIPDLTENLNTPEESSLPEEEVSNPVSQGQVPEEHQKAFKTILDQIRISERDIRFRQVKSLKRNELFWIGQFNVYWNDVIGDWQSVAEGVRSVSSEELNVDPSLYEKAKVDIYRAYGESVIGAVSNGVPHVRYFPKNPENPDDIRTSESFSIIGENIEEENDAEFLVRRASTLLWNQGFVACYNFSHFDKAYGTSQQRIFGAKKYTSKTSSCPLCGEMIKDDYYPTTSDQGVESDIEILERPLSDEFSESGMMEVDGNVEMPEMCPSCQRLVSPMTEQNEFEAPYVKETRDVPKCRQILEFYGPLNVQIPYYARLPKDIGWIILSNEVNYAQMRDLYSDVVCLDGTNLSDKIQPGDPGSDETYERWLRTDYDYFSSKTQLVTVQRIWYKPWMFETLGNKEESIVQELKEAYPNGVYVVFINDTFAEAYPEDPDEHWTFTINPLEERINASPFGKFLVPVQEMINELIFLIMSTIKYGIPVTFADAGKFDFEALGSTQLHPGNIYPIDRSSGEAIGSYIETVKTATLSNEVPDFLKSLEYYAQLVSGAFPQIFGGATNNRTLGQDENARNQALQRLSTLWKMLNEFWASVMSKAVKNHVSDMIEDETYVKSIGTSQVSVEIKLEAMTGEVGEVRPETNEQFPVSWAQQRDEIMRLIELNNPQILQILALPQNIGLMKNVIGVKNLYIPGDDDRNKQLGEIQELMRTLPIPNMDGSLTPSIPIEPDVDNHQLHIMVTQSFLSSEVGQSLKKYNPEGYGNVVLHLQQHQVFLEQQMLIQQAQASSEESSDVNTSAS